MRMPTIIILCILLTNSLAYTSESTSSQDKSHLLSDRQDRHQLETSALKLSVLMGSSVTECRYALADASNYQEIADLLNTMNKTPEEERELYNFFNNWLITQSIDIANEAAKIHDNQARLEKKEKQTRQCFRCSFCCSIVTLVLAFVPAACLSANQGGSSSEG